MLQTQSVDPKLLELLRKIMNCDSFSDFNLAGGTSLALQKGHRKSIDIEFFGKSTVMILLKYFQASEKLSR